MKALEGLQEEMNEVRHKNINKNIIKKRFLQLYFREFIKVKPTAIKQQKHEFYYLGKGFKLSEDWKKYRTFLKKMVSIIEFIFKKGKRLNGWFKGGRNPTLIFVKRLNGQLDLGFFRESVKIANSSAKGID